MFGCYEEVKCAIGVIGRLRQKIIVVLKFGQEVTSRGKGESAFHMGYTQLGVLTNKENVSGERKRKENVS